MKTLYACLFLLPVSLTAVEAQSPSEISCGQTELFLQAGNAIAHLKNGPGLGVGFGVQRGLSTRWAVRAQAEFSTAAYDASEFERRVLDVANRLAPSRREEIRPATRSYALAASLVRTIGWGEGRCHHVNVGLGLLGRVVELRSAGAVFTNQDFPATQTFLQVSDQVYVRSLINLAPFVEYKTGLTDRISAGAFLRYELNAWDDDNGPYQTFNRLDDTGQIVGFTNGFLDFLDGPRAMSWGLNVYYRL